MIDLAPFLERRGLVLADMFAVVSALPRGKYAARCDVFRDLIAAGHNGVTIGEALGLDRRDISARCRAAGISLPKGAPQKRRGWAGAKPKHAPPPDDATPVKLRLVAPDSPWSSHVRRADCAELSACEDQWILASIAATGTVGEQAWCPRRCAAYVARGG